MDKLKSKSQNPTSTPFFMVTNKPLDPTPLVALVGAPVMGAVVIFAGIARNNFGGRPTAYLMLNTHWEDQRNPNRRARFVFEYAGSRTALAGATSLIIAELGLEELHFPVAWQDQDLMALQEKRQR
jgi:hypothetical protein